MSLKSFWECKLVTVISLGGSIIVPDNIDIQFLKDFTALIVRRLSSTAEEKFIIVTGGGGIARDYQRAYSAIRGGDDDSARSAVEADWIGIMATRLNAQLLHALLWRYAPQDVVTDPTNVGVWTGRVLIAAGWKPGFSSDNDAVLLAERFGAKTVINLSNIEKVYSADPKTNPEAVPLDSISWKDFRKMIGDQWIPGRNVPFDPVASKRASEQGVTVICAAGKNLANLESIIMGQPFTGTTIGA
jgi:uridylate kinase